MPKEHEDLTEKSFVRGTNYRKSRLRRTPIKISLGAGREEVLFLVETRTLDKRVVLWA